MKLPAATGIMSVYWDHNSHHWQLKTAPRQMEITMFICMSRTSLLNAEPRDVCWPGDVVSKLDDLRKQKSTESKSGLGTDL